MTGPPDTPIEEMVEYVDWLVPTDYDILQFFDDHRIIINAADLARNIDRDDTNVRQRCYLLEDAGLLTQDGRSWRLTEYGERFLDGELTNSELPEEPAK